ncbi:MAG: hypothetical protein JNK82_24525 [Myxococcaceae bacterium]|nr:hypothetical protein [Myxococcaceae bacterium]
MSSLALLLLLAAEPTEVKIKVGQDYPACGVYLVCPAQNPICDDPNVAKPDANGKGELVWRGVSPGTTKCSAAGGAATAMRAVFKVTVTPR